MSEVRVGKNESLDSALRRFKRTCQKSGVMAEIRKHEHYEKPSVKRKKKAEARQLIISGFVLCKKQIKLFQECSFRTLLFVI